MSYGALYTNKPDDNKELQISEQDRFGLIAVHAFFLAEKNGLERSNWHHWQQAEREVNSIYQASK
jgi:hypothetical protein